MRVAAARAAARVAARATARVATRKAVRVAVRVAVREAAAREVVVREAARGGHSEQEACRALVQARGRVSTGWRTQQLETSSGHRAAAARAARSAMRYRCTIASTHEGIDVANRRS